MKKGGSVGMSDYAYFEDFVVGLKRETAPVTVSAEEIIDFARQFDPQPMHIDPEAAKAITGGLIASGWHTASLTMRMLITGGHYNPAPGTLGLGFENLRWLKPVRPGDSLRLRLEVMAVRASRSRPDRGIVTNRFITLNQHDTPVQEMTSSAIVPLRHPPGQTS
jgi:acyl dehydratase